MNIAYASDDNFVDVMLVSIMSFNDHNSDASIYILDCGITEQNKQKILELCSGKNTVLFVDAKKRLDSLDYDLNLDRGSIASYGRLFIGSMLPDDVKKVIYLDCDTLIRQALEDLFYVDVAPYVIGGIRDSFSALNKKVFGIKRGGLFINAGVLLIDLSRWREEKIEAGILKLLKEKEKIFQGDQGVINTIFLGNVYELPLKYDVMTYLYDFSYKEMMLYRKPDKYFDQKEVKEATKNPVIVHFSSSFASRRPWENNNDISHPFQSEWDLYYKKTGKDKACTKRKSLAHRSIVLLWAIGVIHAYLRPLLFLIRERDKA